MVTHQNYIHIRREDTVEDDLEEEGFEVWTNATASRQGPWLAATGNIKLAFILTPHKWYPTHSFEYDKKMDIFNYLKLAGRNYVFQRKET